MTAPHAQAFIALGSNLEHPLKQVRQAIDALRAHPDIEFIAQSHWYQSRPVGPQDQPDYINGVAQVSTHLSPLALLDVLQQIEHDHGRVRLTHWGPRTLDLDLLWFAGMTWQDERLTLPHPRMCERNFVLLPLCDLAPELELSQGLSATQWAQAVGQAGIERLHATA